MTSKYIKVGRIQDAQGIRGELFIQVFAERADWVKSFKQLLLTEIDSGPVFSPTLTLNITSVREHRKGGKLGLVVRTDKINDRNQAEGLKGKLVLIPDEWLKTTSQTDFYLAEILNFEVISHSLNESIGTIVDFSSNGFQDLAVIDTGHGKYDVPLVDAFIVKIDYEAKTITMSLPYGLLGEDENHDHRDNANEGEIEIESGNENENKDVNETQDVGKKNS